MRLRQVLFAAILSAAALPIYVDAIEIELVTDLNSDSIPLSPRNISSIGSGRFVFTGDHDAGHEPWITDGTETGTKMLADVTAGLGIATVREAVSIGEKFYLEIADESTSNRYLWISDGTPSGTRQLSEGGNRVRKSDFTRMVAFNGGVYFNSIGGKLKFGDSLGNISVVADENLAPIAACDSFLLLMKSTSPTQLKVVPLSSSSPISLGTIPANFTGLPNAIGLGGKVYLGIFHQTLGYELAIIDGTPSGILIIDLLSGPASSNPTNFKRFEGKILFQATSPLGARKNWVSDGTLAGTVELGTLNSALDTAELIWANSALYRFVGGALSRYRTLAGTPEPITGHANSSSRTFSVGTQGGLYWGTQQCGENGTNCSTTFYHVDSISTQAQVIGNFAGLTGTALAAADAGSLVFGYPVGIGSALAVSNPSDRQLRLIQPLTSRTADSRIRALSRVGDDGIFLASIGNTLGIYRTDGTAQGTALLRSIPGSFSPNYNNHRIILGLSQRWAAQIDSPSSLDRFWVSDGTPAGTTEIVPPLRRVDSVHGLGQYLIFFGSNATYDATTWVINVTNGASGVIADLTGDDAPFRIDGCRTVIGKLLCTLETRDRLLPAGMHIASIDPVAGAVELIGVIPDGFGDEDLENTFEFRGRFWLLALGQSGLTLYSTAGVQGDLKLEALLGLHLEAIIPDFDGESFGIPDRIATTQENIYFSLGELGLVRSNGSAAGTLLLPPPCTNCSISAGLVAGVKQSAYYHTTSDPETLAVINDGAPNANLVQTAAGELVTVSGDLFTQFDSKVVFRGENNLYGYELGIMDHGGKNARYPIETLPGTLSGNPQNFLKIKNGLIFTAIDPSHGNELRFISDNCRDDDLKLDPGICGCGLADIDSDEDGTLDCFETCPNDPGKLSPGVCGCGIADADFNSNGLLECLEAPIVAKPSRVTVKVRKKTALVSFIQVTGAQSELILKKKGSRRVKVIRASSNPMTLRRLKVGTYTLSVRNRALAAASVISAPSERVRFKIRAIKRRR